MCVFAGRVVLSLVAAVLTAFPGRLYGQVRQPSFEVASIKEASSPSENTRAGQFHVGMKIDGSRADYGFLTLADLIPYAYRVKRYQVTGPGWLNDTRWNILAKIPADQSAARAPDMMQTLLADRFALSLHREHREQPVYALVVGKGSLRLKAPTTDDKGASDGFSIKNDANGMVISGGAAGAVRLMPGSNGGMHMLMTKISMAVFADVLTQFMDRPVVDATALKGNYEVTLDVPIEALAGMSFDQKVAAFAGLSAFGTAGVAADLSVAIVDAVKTLGLDLQPRKSSVEILVVDRIEKSPTAN